MNNTKFSFGDIILIDFPFTDFEQTKKRPALILQKELEDVLVVFISSQLGKKSDFDILLLKDQENNLMVDSLLKTKKITVLHTDLIYKKIGTISAEQKQIVKEKLIRFIHSLF